MVVAWGPHIQHLLGANPVPKDAQTLLVFYTREKEIIIEKGTRRLITFTNIRPGSS